jgi:hypothetical protein
VSYRPQEGASSSELAYYIQETIRIERQARAVHYAKLVSVVAAALLLVAAPDKHGLADSLALQSTATVKNQLPEGWTRLAFGGGLLR